MCYSSFHVYFTSTHSPDAFLIRLKFGFSDWAIGGHNPPDINPLGQNPLSVARSDETPQDITPCRIRTQCAMSFSAVTGKGVLKAKYQDWRT